MAVRRTARRHGLHTDASHRFERGADFNAAPVASALVSRILLANGGCARRRSGRRARPRIEARTAQPQADRLSHSAKCIASWAQPEDKEGITAATVETVLTALGCGLTATESAQSGDAVWQVTLPSWRLDLEREIDLIEEVARVYGYNRFANTLPSFGEGVQALPWAESESAVRRTLLAAGFNEAIASTFCSAAKQRSPRRSPAWWCPSAIPSAKRPACCVPRSFPACLAMVAGNLHRDVSDVRLFELGTVFSGTTEKVEERPALAFSAVGQPAGAERRSILAHY